MTPVLNKYRNRQSLNDARRFGTGYVDTGGENYCFTSICGLIGVLIIVIGFALLLKAEIENEIYYILPLLYLYFTFGQLSFWNLIYFKDELIKNEYSFVRLQDLFEICLLSACIIGTIVGPFLLQYFSFEMLNKWSVASYSTSLFLLWLVDKSSKRFKVLKTRQVHFVSESLNL